MRAPAPAHPTAPSHWPLRAGYAALVLAILLVHLLPVEFGLGGWVWPDLLLVVSCVWVVRRPGAIPVWAFALTFLLADLLLQRPPGLWAALAVIATEALRGRADDMREVVFSVECAYVALAITGLYAGFAAIWYVLVPYAMPYGLLAMQWLLTCLAYPIAALLGAALFGLSKRPASATDNRGAAA
ncbi:MAG: rod shape-determining protein MreD [Pseudomonadota bacterium]